MKTPEKKITKQHKAEKDRKMRKHQTVSMLFLCCTLMLLIVAGGVKSSSSSSKYYPTTIYAPILHQEQESETKEEEGFPTEIGEISLGTELGEEQRIEKAKKRFSRNTDSIHLSVELINPNKGEEIQGAFFYQPGRGAEPLLLSSSSAKLADKSQDVVVFTLAKPGSSWQLRGNFKAKIVIPSSNIQEEIPFTIY